MDLDVMDLDVLDLDLRNQRELAFDYLFDSVVVVNLLGIIIDWNKGSEALYGYSKEEAIGNPVNILHVPEDSAKITSEVLLAVEKEGKWTGEIRMLHKNGSIGWIESMCVPTFDENQQMTGALGINRNITKRKDETNQLEYLAHYDQLTNIPNRYLLLDRLSHLITQSKRNQHQFALFFIDVDKFKSINDLNGHMFGDQVLKETALRLKTSIRDSDTVARFGGDEFVILFENITKKNDALRMKETLSKVLSEIFVINECKINVSCSIGVAIFPDDGTTSDSLLIAADRAMYQTK
jgi:diguanylate cyclase (GGDEF)-like protein/PAS domain S-box-containing protein